ncbi:pyridoxal phosphate-dependent class II aminotransferase [Halocynthiibacter sp. C4]|uniref:threonine-phosphate decarboxylase n=1 Tax=Halocynthiibacter sp. C4 TaxID=2992758 RepID=UPI00237B833B|nr:threonine-phosphate decarboxylase [Halocynthiibacter sp. C4]MDE0590798.1 pyridoxal phosphate-dependent class II aminotransferase [Halocynthiibacter sp. C4]
MSQSPAPRDHGGNLDAACARYGGAKSEWLDLSTGINPTPYPLPNFAPDLWNALPDKGLFTELETAARKFWNIPESAAVLTAPGCSALIARIPHLAPTSGTVAIRHDTYNEHAASFRMAGWTVRPNGGNASVHVHPNNPTGELTAGAEIPDTHLTIIDESFCDTTPEASHIARTAQCGTLILKSFGKFWGLAGLRLGFAIGDPELIAKLGEMIGPWQVSGPALATGIAALNDPTWAADTREILTQEAARLDELLQAKGAKAVGGTTLFRLYSVDNAAAWQDRLARGKVLTRVFPYSETFLRIGLPPRDRWTQLEAAL